LMQAEGARVRVLNGTSTKDLDTQTAGYLSLRGLLVTEVESTKLQSRTTVILYSPKLYTLRFLVDIFRLTKSSQILIKPDASETVDIEVRVGSDWVASLPPNY